MKDYQQKRMKEYLLPEAVYRQALWAAKDLLRMKERLKKLTENQSYIPALLFDSPGAGRSASSYAFHETSYGDRTARIAIESSNLAMRIEAVESAVLALPEKYRQGMMDKVTEGKAFDDSFHPNTWKKWQQVYIFNVAKNLGLY